MSPVATRRYLLAVLAGSLVLAAAVRSAGSSVAFRPPADAPALHALSLPRAVAAGERTAFFVGLSSPVTPFRVVVRACDQGGACVRLSQRTFEGATTYWGALPAITLAEGRHRVQLFLQAPWRGDRYRTIAWQEVEIVATP